MVFNTNTPSFLLHSKKFEISTQKRGERREKRGESRKKRGESREKRGERGKLTVNIYSYWQLMHAMVQSTAMRIRLTHSEGFSVFQH